MVGMEEIRWNRWADSGIHSSKGRARKNEVEPDNEDNQTSLDPSQVFITEEGRIEIAKQDSLGWPCELRGTGKIYSIPDAGKWHA